MERLLIEFPWLWAIRGTWNSIHHKIKVIDMNRLDYLRLAVDYYIHYWVKTSGTFHSSVIKIPTIADTPECHTLAQLVLKYRKLYQLDRLEFIVCEIHINADGSPLMTNVIRPPRKRSLLAMCERAARQ